MKSGALEGGLIFVAFSLEMKYISRLVVVVVVELKGTGFHLALVFTASLSEVENGVKPCRICKTFWRIQNKLIWRTSRSSLEIGRLCFVKAINPCRARSFSDGFRASFASLNTLSRIISLERTRKKSVQPGTNWLSQCCDCMVFLPLTFLASA